MEVRSCLHIYSHFNEGSTFFYFHNEMTKKISWEGEKVKAAKENIFPKFLILAFIKGITQLNVLCGTEDKKSYKKNLKTFYKDEEILISCF